MKSRYFDKALRSKVEVVLVILALLLPATCGASSADDSNTQAVSAATSATPDTTNPSTQLPVLEGSVQKITLDLDQLRDVGLDLKHLVKSLSSLYDEVTCEPMGMLSEPEMVGPVIISIPTIMTPIGPPQPARKERVDLAMSEIKPVIDMMKKNVNQFVSGQVKFDLPDSTMAQIQPLFDLWISDVNDLYSKELVLEGMTQGPPYNNYKIADQTMAMEKEIKKLDKSRHSIFKIVRAEGKTLIREERKDKRH
jgi:hypothetical protein